MTVRDLIGEVRADIESRPGRAALTALGTLVGVGVLVSTLVLATSLGAQIGDRFDALRSPVIRVASAEDDTHTEPSLPKDAVARAERLDAVSRAALVTEIPDVPVSGTPLHQRVTDLVPVYASSASLAEVIDGEVRGVFFDGWHDRNAVGVAVLGAGAAQRLGVHDVASQPVIFVDDQPLVVVGILDKVGHRPDLLEAVIVPQGVAVQRWGLQRFGALLVGCPPPAMEAVSSQVTMAVRPDQPEVLVVEVPPAPERTRQLLVSDAQALVVVLGIVSLVIGGIGIANITLVSVLERTPEIGLRRALGATRRFIMLQFLTGTAVMGLVGGTVGMTLGTAIGVAAAVLQGWPPVLPWVVLGCAPMLGAALGLLAGSYPARRAAHVEPIAALRTL